MGRAGSENGRGCTRRVSHCGRLLITAAAAPHNVHARGCRQSSLRVADPGLLTQGCSLRAAHSGMVLFARHVSVRRSRNCAGMVLFLYRPVSVPPCFCTALFLYCPASVAPPATKRINVMLDVASVKP
eukprot:366061-Chlamydomonas_euryale.AAC.5